ncbi:MAG: alpha/beta hydrolase [Halieaceae bacterium]
MREIEFEVFGRTLRALSSGEVGQPPMLALHGWLDNAASFLPLARLLPEFHIVALDMAGHGQSAHRSADGEYNIWSDLPDIQAVADQLGWESFRLLGHSRGAIVASLFAAALPQRVRQLALLDAVLSRSVEASDCMIQMADFLSDKSRLLDKQSRVFKQIADAVAIRERKGLSAQAAQLIAERNLRQTDGGWCWSMDARLQGASALKLTEAHNQAILAGLSMPVLLLLAEQGFVKEHPQLGPLPESICVETVPGGHHCHMEESAQLIADRLRQLFLAESDA